MITSSLSIVYLPANTKYGEITESNLRTTPKISRLSIILSKSKRSGPNFHVCANINVGFLNDAGSKFQNTFN